MFACAWYSSSAVCRFVLVQMCSLPHVILLRSAGPWSRSPRYAPVHCLSCVASSRYALSASPRQSTVHLSLASPKFPHTCSSGARVHCRQINPTPVSIHKMSNPPRDGLPNNVQFNSLPLGNEVLLTAPQITPHVVMPNIGTPRFFCVDVSSF